MKRLSFTASGLTASEYKTLVRLSTPIKIQNFLDAIPSNWEKNGDTYMSPRRVLREKKAHCFEGALLAAAALWIAGEPPLIVDLKPLPGKDFDHVVTLYKRNGYYGAISKTNYATLRFRDPIYRTLRELILSYFNEWVLDTTGEKVLERYSKPLDLRRIGVPSGTDRFGAGWLTEEKDLHAIADALDTLPYYKLVPKKNWRYVRSADAMELKAGRLLEWPRSNPRT